MLFFAGAHKFEACVHLMSTLLQYGPFIELMSFNYCLRTVTGHMISAGTSLDIVVQLSQKLASIGGQASISSREDLMLVFHKKKELGKMAALVGGDLLCCFHFLHITFSSCCVIHRKCCSSVCLFMRIMTPSAVACLIAAVQTLGLAAADDGCPNYTVYSCGLYCANCKNV